MLSVSKFLTEGLTIHITPITFSRRIITLLYEYLIQLQQTKPMSSRYKYFVGYNI